VTSTLEPFANLGYQRYQRDSYNEKGGDAALKVFGQTRETTSPAPSACVWQKSIPSTTA
jgi:uncharacterized protein with beta-barrel porin domain